MSFRQSSSLPFNMIDRYVLLRWTACDLLSVIAKTNSVPKKTKFWAQPVKTRRKNIAPNGSVISRGWRVGPGGWNTRASESQSSEACKILCLLYRHAEYSQSYLGIISLWSRTVFCWRHTRVHILSCCLTRSSDDFSKSKYFHLKICHLPNVHKSFF